MTTVQWVTTEPNPHSLATGFDAGQRGWKLHAVEAEPTATFNSIRNKAALCGLRPKHGWGLDMFIMDECKRCAKKMNRTTQGFG